MSSSSFPRPRSRQSSPASFTPPTPPPAVNDCALSFKDRTAKQPLYRPAALRRNNSATSDLLLYSPSPPLSPAPSSTDLKGSWLAGLAAVANPWSPIGTDRDSNGPVRGSLLPKEQWKRDETAVECADGDCHVRFGLIDRKHHCRRCGFVFCAAHSSRSSLLWTNAEDGSSNPSTPRMTPRSTPRSSTLDIPSLVSPASSGFSSNLSTTTPSSSPPTHSPFPICARVCDSCFFSTTPLLTPPLPSPSTAYAHSPYSRALPLNTSSLPFVRSPLVSPSHSPPVHPPNFAITSSSRTKSRSRSRQGSTSTSYSDHSTPPTSVSTDGSGYARADRKRGVSPAESLRLQAAMLEEVDEPEGSDEEEDRREDETAFGSVAGQWSWNSWATF